MKNTLILVLILNFLAGCNQHKSTPKETVTQYYKAKNGLNYKKIKTLISDRITITAGDYTMSYNQNSFYEIFKWDSIFKTSHKLVALEEKSNHIIATVTSTSIRYEFLKNNPLNCQFRISFNSGKISKMESLDCPNANWNIWQKERDSLVSWTHKNHPRLQGFIHDMTMNGALKYVEAIELYESYKKSP